MECQQRLRPKDTWETLHGGRPCRRDAVATVKLAGVERRVCRLHEGALLKRGWKAVR